MRDADTWLRKLADNVDNEWPFSHIWPISHTRGVIVKVQWTKTETVRRVYRTFKVERLPHCRATTSCV